MLFHPAKVALKVFEIVFKILSAYCAKIHNYICMAFLLERSIQGFSICFPSKNI